MAFYPYFPNSPVQPCSFAKFPKVQNSDGDQDHFRLHLDASAKLTELNTFPLPQFVRSHPRSLTAISLPRELAPTCSLQSHALHQTLLVVCIHAPPTTARVRSFTVDENAAIFSKEPLGALTITVATSSSSCRYKTAEPLRSNHTSRDSRCSSL